MKKKSHSRDREETKSRDKIRNEDKKIRLKLKHNREEKKNSLDKKGSTGKNHHEKRSQRKKSKEKENYFRKVKPVEEYEKEESRKKVRALLQSFYGYTDDNNPFGDPDLSKPFIWHKKIKKMRSKGLEPYLDIQSLILKLRSVKKDLDRIRKNKLEREEMKENNNEQKGQNKETEEQIFDEWKNKDEKFHLAQEKLRTEIRIKQGREKPVDFIHKVLMMWKGFFPIPVDYFEIPEYEKPYLLYDLLDMESLKELYNELNIQLAIDRERLANKKFVCFFIDIASNFKQSHDLSENDLKEFIEYWSAMIIIIESYIFPEKNIKNLDPEMREAIDETLKNRTFDELDEIEKELEKSLNEQIHSADIQFWNNTLCQLRIHRCKIILEIIFQEFKEKHNEQLEQLKKQIDMKNKNMLMRIYNNDDLAKFYEEEEGNLSPHMYESDEELRKTASTEHDYLIRLAETRKIILAQQLGKWHKNINKNIENSFFKDNPVKINNDLIKDKKETKLQIHEETENLNKVCNKEDEIINVQRVNSQTNILPSVKIEEIIKEKNYKEKDQSFEKKEEEKSEKKIQKDIKLEKEINLMANLQNNPIKSSTNITFKQNNPIKSKVAPISKNNLISMNYYSNNSSQSEEEDEELEKYLSKISKKNNNNQNKKMESTGGIHSTNVGLYKNEMNLLLGTASYPVNTLSASRFYLKDDIIYDFNLNNEMLKIESQELGDGETIFNDVIQLNNNNYIWASKYKPRKPRYFNRVKTGYEWNKYNQVHYDLENPPPKVIQGYKFNVFYPDLIDKTKAPQYTLERSDTPDTCMIRFHAGPPYEDIAFKIVNREWDMTEKAGFKNLFDRGILYLYFNFKRYRYKR